MDPKGRSESRPKLSFRNVGPLGFRVQGLAGATNCWLVRLDCSICESMPGNIIMSKQPLIIGSCNNTTTMRICTPSQQAYSVNLLVERRMPQGLSPSTSHRIFCSAKCLSRRRLKGSRKSELELWQDWVGALAPYSPHLQHRPHPNNIENLKRHPRSLYKP